MTAFDEPEGINPRGTVIVAAGRGETAEAYGRFGRRIAADGYRVRVLPDVTADSVSSFAEAEKLLVDDGLPGPHTIVGSDTGALFALALAARRVPGLDAIVLAGLPSRDTAPADWASEIAARTACPAHQRVLTESAGTLATAIPAALIDLPAPVDVPSLGLHGEDDTISPLADARDRYPGLLVTIAGGRHDVLNDVTHRTVAATVVLFLERLRLGADLPEIARAAS